MAACLPTTSIHHHHHPAFSNTPVNLTTVTRGHCSTNRILSASALRRSSSSLTLSNRNSFYRRCRATSPGPPSPPEPEKDAISISGLTASLSRFQETGRIFLAVLFWMSLFFWASAWDGRNNGRPDKGSRFRK